MVKSAKELAELKATVAKLVQLIDDEPSVHWHREHDKNHKLYLVTRKYMSP